MGNRFRLAGRALAAALVLVACQEAAGPVATAGGAGSSDDTQCVGVLTGAHDNVVVPSGQFCNLVSATVKGSVLVLPNASLRAMASTIMGNVKGDQSRFACLVFGTTVGGNFDVKGGAPGTTSGHDINTVVRGNTSIIENAGHTFIDAATVGQDILVAKNRGSIEVEFNTVGNLQVQENTPSATFTGDLTFQCGIPTALVLLTGGMSIFNNDVGDDGGGNLQVFKNTGPANKQVVGNTVQGIIQCYDNQLPFLGGPNIGRADPPPNQCVGTPLL